MSLGSGEFPQGNYLTKPIKAQEVFAIPKHYTMLLNNVQKMWYCVP